MALHHLHKKTIATTDLPKPHEGTTAVLTAVKTGEFILSVSTMLGCDYVFVTHTEPNILLAPQRLQQTIRELLDMLDTSPKQSLVVGVTELPYGQWRFTRYDCVWENRKLTKMNPTIVTGQEQIDFMQMMFDCSSTC